MNSQYSIYFNKAEIQLMEAGHSTVGDFWHNMVTFFPFYRLYYVVKGKASLFLRNKTLEMSENNFYFIPSYSVFGAKCEEEFEHYWIHFNLDPVTEKYLSVFHPDDCKEATVLETEIFKKIVEITGDYSLKKKPYYNEKSDNDSNTLAADGLMKYLFSRFLPAPEVSLPAKEAKFLPVLNYIEDNFCKKITNKELADILYLNATYFSNTFTKQFGISPQQYILQKRLSLAIKLLYRGDKTITEIAYLCGFESETYFNRQFSKTYGTPPGRYRKRVFNVQKKSKQ